MKKDIRKLKMLYNFIYIFIIIFFISSCNTQELKIESVIPCESADENGVCEKLLNVKKEYSLSIPKDSKTDNLNQLSNYLYFKNRLSSGFVIKFNRPFLFEELEEIKSTYKVYYNFSGTTGQLENIEFGNDFIYSYVYLGTILKEKNKERKEESKNIGKSLILQFSGSFNYKSSLFKGDINTIQDLIISKDL
jgi:hypothetical protein